MRDPALCDDLGAADYIDHAHQQQGIENFKGLFSLAFNAFPDRHGHIEDIIAEDDRVWVRARAAGTHTGEWNLSGVLGPPTGRKVAMTMVFIWRIVDGRLAEGWEVDDELDVSQATGSCRIHGDGKEDLFARMTGDVCPFFIGMQGCPSHPGKNHWD